MSLHDWRRFDELRYKLLKEMDKTEGFDLRGLVKRLGQDAEVLTIETVSYRQLKQAASRFTGNCFSSNVLLKSHAPSTGSTGHPTRRPVSRQTPLTVAGQLHWIVANVAPHILPSRGEVLRRYR